MPCYVKAPHAFVFDAGQNYVRRSLVDFVLRERYRVVKQDQ